MGAVDQRREDWSQGGARRVRGGRSGLLGMVRVEVLAKQEWGL